LAHRPGPCGSERRPLTTDLLLAYLEEAKEARAEERAKGTAKGADFEDAIEERLGAMARGLGDLVELAGTEGGDAVTSKKGDLVITIDPTRTRGTTLPSPELDDGQVPCASSIARSSSRNGPGWDTRRRSVR
jgi:hypothetical protein